MFAATLDGSDDIIIYNQNGIWRSEDFGTSWIYIPNYFYTEALIIDKEDVIYRADYAEFTPQGVFRSKDNGYTCEQINSGINYYDKAIKEFALSKDGYLFARGYKGFIYRSVEPVYTGIFNNSVDMTLKIYPNPFVDYIQLDINDAPVSSEKEIIVSIFDMMGRKVYETTVKRGKIYLSHLSKGIYNICVEYNGEVVNKKMLKM